jgi:hypothetical protein
MINYFKKWVEAIPVNMGTHKIVIEFMKERIITMFGIPTKITFDNANEFMYVDLKTF